MIYPNYLELTTFDGLDIFCWFEKPLNKLGGKGVALAQ